MANWHEDDSFWSTFFPAMFSPKKWASAPADVDAILALLELPEGAAVLDAGCGPGRHSLELARRGFRVTAVDRTPLYLEIARQHAEADELEIAFAQEDLRIYRTEETSDAAVNLFTTFGYFDDPAEDRLVVQNLYESLRPGGKLVMDMMGKEVVARAFQPRYWSELDDGRFFLEERTMLDGWGGVENRWVLLGGEEPVERRFRVRLYSGSELECLMGSIGFSDIRLLGDLDGRPYDLKARRLVAVGRKPTQNNDE
jgi:SAM-dependent methyltransferase